MSVERRYAASYRESPSTEPGLLLEDDGDVVVVLADGTRATLGEGGDVVGATGATGPAGSGATGATGPSAADGVLTRTVTLTAAQVRALVNTPREIVPAPGSGKMIAGPNAGLSLFALVIHGGIPFTSLDPSMRVLWYVGTTNSSGIFAAWGSSGEPEQFFAVSDDPFLWVPSQASLVPVGTQDGPIEGSAVDNKPLKLQLTIDGNANLTSGDGDTMDVTVQYSVIDL